MSVRQVWVQRAATAFRGRYCEIKAFTLPGESETDRRLDFYGEGHLFATPAWPNFAIGFWYESGPMARITVTVDGRPFDLTPGSGVVVYVTPRPDPCYSLKRSYSMTLTEEGEYGFAFLAGYLDLERDVFYYDDKVERAVSVTKPPTKPPWWPDWIPFEYWWVLAAGGGALALIVVGAVIYAEERRREEMLMMMLMK